MANAGNNATVELEEDHMLFNDHHQQQSPLHNSSIVTTNKSRNNKPTAQRTARKIPNLSAGSSPCSCSIILEDGKDLPVFWNGENAVPLIKWRPSLESEEKKQPFFTTINDFLSTYVAGRYLKKCSMSLQASSTKYINTLKMSDPFSKILEHRNKDGKPVTLLLTYVNGDDGESGYSKFTLYIRELDGKKVLWNGSIPTNRIVAKLNQSDMSMTIENLLQNYVARGYLSQNVQVDLVKERSDTNRTSKEELNTISEKDLVNTLFKGNSACIVIRSSSVTSSSSSCYDNDVSQFAGNSLEELSPSSSTKIAIFTTPPIECHWVGMTWGGIKDEVGRLVNSVEITMRDLILPTDAYARVLDKKRALQTAIRRRSRVVDEVWRRFSALRSVHNDILNGNMRPGQNSVTSFHSIQSVVLGTGGDIDNVFQIQRSCIDFLSSSLIRAGLELELYDEESQGFSRIAGVGVGIAVVVTICAVVYYY